MSIEPERPSSQVAARMDEDKRRDNASSGSRDVLEPEIIQPDEYNSRGWRTDSSYSAHSRTGAFADNGFGRIWTVTSQNQNACLSPCITLGIFCVCLFQLGFLAAIGFMFFYTIGAIIGSLRSMRQMIDARPVNPWPWRVGNWLVSFLLTSWLAS